jgi:hypothetical protein
MPFRSRCQIYDSTTNTIADRTRPAIWLGSKSNAYGSGCFFTLDTEQVVSREQWRHMPLDSGTINLKNRISPKGPALPKNLRMIYKGIEVEGDCQTTETEPYSSGGASFLDGADVEPIPFDMGDGDVLGVDESPDMVADSTAQLEHVEPVSEIAEVRDENVDALEGKVDVGDHHRDINEAVERTTLVWRPRHPR